EAVADEQGGDDEGDHGDRRRFDPEHETGGGLDVAVGTVSGSAGGNQGQERTGDGMAVDGGDQDAGVVDESTDDGGSGGDVGEQECSASGPTADWRKRVGRVLVERAGGSGSSS